MTNVQTLLLLPGDGIGPGSGRGGAVAWPSMGPDLEIDLRHSPAASPTISSAAPLTEEVMAQARKSDADPAGLTVGGPQWDRPPRDKRPEAALLAMREKSTSTPTCVRPSASRPLLAASALKKELVEGLDVVIVRSAEASGVCFGQPKTIETLPEWRAPRHRHAELHDQRNSPRRCPRPSN